MRRPHFIFSTTLLIAGLLPGFASAAAELSFSPSSGSYGVGKTFTVQIVADSPDPFNSANATINFSKDTISVQSVSKTASAFSLWAVEPSSSNVTGTVGFEGGNTTPLTSKKQLLAITFKAIKEGEATITYGAASVLAADGKGTNIVGEKKSATFTITAAQKEETPPPSDDGPPTNTNIPPPDLPEITSSTHPEQNKWFNGPKAKFAWELPADVTIVRLALDKSPSTTPTTSYDPAIADKDFDSLDEGISYFHLRYKNDAGWGPTAHRKVMVDKEPPPAFTLETADPTEAGDVTLKFNATDTLSGLERYEIAVDGGNPSKVNLIEVGPAGYVLSGQIPGSHDVNVRAYDKAGNFSEANGKYLIPGELPKAGVAEEVVVPTDWKMIWIIILIALLAFIIGYIVYERKTFRHEKFVVKRESDEVRDTVGNVFSALREEIGEQVGYLFQQPNPSAQDREVMERINEAVDFSEEIIAKEVEDTRKLLM